MEDRSGWSNYELIKGLVNPDKRIDLPKLIEALIEESGKSDLKNIDCEGDTEELYYSKGQNWFFEFN